MRCHVVKKMKPSEAGKAKCNSTDKANGDREEVNPFGSSPEAKYEMDRLLSSRRKEYRSIASLDIDKRGGFCGCKCFKCCYVDPEIKEEKEAIMLWHRKYCKTFEDFKSHMGETTQLYMSSVASLRAIISNLTYWDDPSPGLEGLTKVGSYTWLVTSALQTFVDKDSDFYWEHLEYVKTHYQNLAAAAELFLEQGDGYFQHIHRMRNDGIIIVKKLVTKWQLQDSDPLISHPITKPNRRRPRRHIGNGLDVREDIEDDDHFFHVQLNQHRVMCSPKNSSEWVPFSEVYPTDKVEISQMFLQLAEDLVENTTEDIRMITGEMTAIEIKGSTVKSQAREITGAMRHFVKSYKRKDALDAEEQKSILHLVEEFWLALDRLHDDSYELLRLAQETRDIIRTCYIYLDAFYKFDMPDYDSFLLCVKNRKDKQDTKKAMKYFWEKLVTYNHEHRKLSEVLKFLSLSDFTTSVYQLVVAKHAIRLDGISLKVESYDEPSEPWGLIGQDIRKTRSSSHKKVKRSMHQGNDKVVAGKSKHR